MRFGAKVVNSSEYAYKISFPFYYYSQSDMKSGKLFFYLEASSWLVLLYMILGYSRSFKTLPSY